MYCGEVKILFNTRFPVDDF